jgi:hypothetical protein
MDEIEKTVCIGDVAKALHVNPRVLTSMFYDGAFPASITDRCEIINNKRRIPVSVVPQIIDALMRRGGMRARVPLIQ